ncbi:MAG: hypothetical protein J5778_02220 [Clostridiales bacterium]|nr:hypothetical protein [Clostridiales bacterium]
MDLILSISLWEAIRGNLPLAIVIALILVVAGVAMGYIVGNTSLRKKVTEEYSKIAGRDLVKKSVLEEVGLGVIVYDNSGMVYANAKIFDFPGFGRGKGIPKTLDTFLDAYDDGDNRLKSSYILGCENGINIIRANYICDKHIYEIKIVRNAFADEEYKVFHDHDLKIVIIDDITQIKDDERRQKDLAANVSHELKTPLTVIKMSEYFFENISPDNMPSYEDVKRWGERISVNADRMRDIVQDFLVLSECSHVNRMTVFDIKDDVSKALSNITDYPGRENVHFIMPEDKQYPLLYGNASLVMRVIINLLTNAVKYIDYEGKTVPNEIKIMISEIGDQISVQIEDNGRGIPEESLNHLFERFYRVDNSGNRQVGGSGIGLSIAKEIAEMHGGSISVVSGVGSGSVFNFTMPTADAVFETVHKDASSGVISEIQIYKSAAQYLCMQISETVKSFEYEDMYDKVKEYEESPAETRHKAMTALLRAFDENRFKSLTEELLYTEDEDMSDYGEYDPETGIVAKEPEDTADALFDRVAQASAAGAVPMEEDNSEGLIQASKAQISPENSQQPVQIEPKEDAKILQNVITEQPANDVSYSPEDDEAEQIRKAKEEARKILTTPVTQLSAAPSATSGRAAIEKMKEKAAIHPESSPRRSRKKPESESKLKKLLDDSAPIGEN